jgi:hypothetical protein
MQEKIALLSAAVFCSSVSVTRPAFATPSSVDASDFRDDLVVLKASGGHFLVTSIEETRDRSFWGTKSTVHALSGRGGGGVKNADGKYTSVQASFTDTKSGSDSYISLDWKDDTWSLRCGDTPIELTPLSGEPRARFLDGVEFKTRYWEREPIMLARDEYGVYYYVDKNKTDKSPESYHIYTGWMGNMVKSPLVLVAQDYEGIIFSTRSGDRRLIVDSEVTHWIEDEESKKLRVLSVHANHDFIYSRLGIYSEQAFGSPCDHL